MASLNKVNLIGNLGANPEVRFLPDGTATVTLSIATTDSWKDKATGEKVEKTEWHKVAFFDGLAKIVGEHLQKGSQIFVEGKLRTRKWTDKEGVERYTTEIRAESMIMLGSKKTSNGSASNDDTSHGNEGQDWTGTEVPF